jgi:hypothetical protein
VTADVPGSIRPFYADWAGYNRRAIDGLERLGAAELALRRPGSEHWPIWAIAAHMAGTRIYWLCEIFGEPGIERMTVLRAGRHGLGGLPGHASIRPRDRRRAPRQLGGRRRLPRPLDAGDAGGVSSSATAAAARTRSTRGSRSSCAMINHEAYHLGEINIALGANGRDTIDPWPGSDWASDAPRFPARGALGAGSPRLGEHPARLLPRSRRHRQQSIVLDPPRRETPRPGPRPRPGSRLRGRAPSTTPPPRPGRGTRP